MWNDEIYNDEILDGYDFWLQNLNQGETQTTKKGWSSDSLPSTMEYLDQLELQNLSSTLQAENAATEIDESVFTITEKVLVGIWLVFTSGVFGLLYKITSEADEMNVNDSQKSLD